MTQLHCLRFGGFFAGHFCGIFSAYIWHILLQSFLFTFLVFFFDIKCVQYRAGNISEVKPKFKPFPSQLINSKMYTVLCKASISQAFYVNKKIQLKNSYLNKCYTKVILFYNLHLIKNREPGGPQLEHLPQLVPGLAGSVEVTAMERLLGVIGYILPCTQEAHHHKRRMETEAKGKGRRNCFEEQVSFFLFFQMDQGKIAGTARN